ncbi:MAG: hypothetical protein NVSMB62_00240 [Acidobacteriaceae bacterium]
MAAPAQTLAHPNWVGNGMSTDPWWQHAVVFRIRGSAEQVGGARATPADYKYLSSRINALRSIGFDALLLPAPEIPGQGSGTAAPQSASNQSEIDQLDDLIRLASSRGVRVLLTLHPASASEDLSGNARFWLSRGIAGFHVITPQGANSAEALAMVQSLRRLTAGVVGQRIVISDLDLATSDTTAAMLPAAPIARRTGAAHGARTSDIAPQLELDSRLDHVELKAATLRGLLAQTSGQPNLLLDLDNAAASPAVGSGSPANRASFARVVATLALLNHPSALVDSDVNLVLDPAPEHTDADDADQPKPAAAPPPQPGVYLPYKPYVPTSKARNEPAQPAPKDPLTLWYKQLAALHHGNGAVRAGAQTLLDFDSQNALVWVSRASTPSAQGAPVVVACNLSGAPVQLSLRAPLESLGLRGNYLRTLLRSDRMLGPQDLTTVTLPAYGVYIGELRR